MNRKQTENTDLIAVEDIPPATLKYMADAIAKSGLIGTPMQLFRAMEQMHPEHLAKLMWLDRHYPEPLLN